MSYQRPDSVGRYYVWMGSDGLHIMHDTEKLADCRIIHRRDGIDNAKAIMRGLVDFLASEDIEVKIKHGQPEFKKGKKN